MSPFVSTHSPGWYAESAVRRALRGRLAPSKGQSSLVTLWPCGQVQALVVCPNSLTPGDVKPFR
jgi:hypothetical protein